jgi:hypothetical protein
MTLQEWTVWTQQDREAAIKLFLNREFVEGSMSDWRKILVAYIRHVKANKGTTYVPQADNRLEIENLTDAELASLAAAVREAEGK